jgi:glycosyltransferase involved in cell wall biosynthesis
MLCNAENAGSSISRSYGLQASCGDYVIFIDSDDWIENTMLEKMYNAAIHKNSDIVFCNIIVDNKDKSKIWDKKQDCLEKLPLIKQLLLWHSGGIFCPSVWNKLVKRTVYLEVVFPTASHMEDSAISVQLLYYAKKIESVGDILYHYCINSESLSNREDMAKITKERFFNYQFIVNFLFEKYAKNIMLFEPQLSVAINTFKNACVKNQESRYIDEFIQFYPQSAKLIFDHSFKIGVFQKLFLYIAVKTGVRLQYGLLDIFRCLKNRKPANEQAQ